VIPGNPDTRRDPDDSVPVNVSRAGVHWDDQRSDGGAVCRSPTACSAPRSLSVLRTAVAQLRASCTRLPLRAPMVRRDPDADYGPHVLALGNAFG